MADTKEQLTVIFGLGFYLKKFTKRLMVFNVIGVVLVYVTLLVPAVQPLNSIIMGLTLGGFALQFLMAIVALLTKGLREFGAGMFFVTPLMAIGSAVPFVIMMAGGGWGRPLRIRGKQLHPELCEGTDWTRGAQPDITGLDEDTRKALAALWLHDAQKEHASVPAFSRISWMLAAIGAPAELMAWSHQAALEEIEHTRICFALAAGYGGTSHSVEPMPDLLIGALEEKDDPVIVLAKESLEDGCQLEDFNADIAAACAVGCTDAATRGVLEQVAREERLHADFSWALLEWLYARWPAKVRPEMEKGLRNLGKIQRPTAVSWQKLPLVQKANPELMLRHGRMPDTRWAELWEVRIAANRERLAKLLEPLQYVAA